MKKFLHLIFVMLAINLLWGCATNKTSSIQAMPDGFSTESYQAILIQSLSLTDSLANFDNIPNVELEPSDFSVLMQADMNFNQGNYGDAAQLYVILANKYKDPRIIYKSITSLNKLAKNQAQQDELHNMINLLAQNAPNSDLVHLLEIKQNLKSDNISQAKTDLDDLMKNNSDNPRVLLLFLSTDLLDLGKIDESWLEYVTTKYGEYPEAHLLVSVGYAINNNVPQLDTQVKYLKTTYPHWEIPYFVLSAIFVKTQSWDKITNVFGIVTKTPPELSMVLQNVYVIALLKTKQLDRANVYLKQRLAQLPKQDSDDMRGNIYLNMAVLQLESQDYNLSLNYLKQAESYGHILNGTVPMLIGAIYDYKSNYNDALVYYKKIGDQNPLLSQVARLAIIQDYFTLGNSSMVNAELDKLTRLNKLDNKQAILLKSAFYLDAEEYQQSYDILAKNLKQYANDKDYLYQYATTLSMLNRTKEAIKIYDKCIKLDKKNSLAYNDLAYVLVTQTKEFSRAKILADKALVIDPDNSAVLDTLAWVYYKQASYAKALVYAKQAYSINKDSEIARHLKAIYIAMGNNDEANKIIIQTNEDRRAEFRQFVLDKASLLLIYFQYGIEPKQ